MMAYTLRFVVLSAGLVLSVSCSPPPTAPESWTDIAPAENPGWFMNVHATAIDDRYAVGGTLTDGAMLHFDGESWSSVDLGVDIPLLNWIHGDGTGRYVAVGNGGTALHFDGAVWTLVETPTEQKLWGVWGSTMDDLWAVGGDAFASDDLRAVILRWDGTSWTEMDAPDPLAVGDLYAWFKVWGSSASDVYIVGQRGAVLHWDGDALTELDVGVDDDLIAVWGTGPDRVAVVGGRNNGVAARWNGTDWVSATLAPMPGLNGIWMREPDRIHVGGNLGSISILDFDSLAVVQEVFLDSDLDVHALHGSP
ncbi:MAG: hypothetical protein QF464_12120, partial [Myxococcota bacterium]|nr:hypothetical protein [Myxococcota bacterium]